MTRLNRFGSWIAAGAAWAVSLGVRVLHAQSQDGFVPATDIKTESLPAWPLLYSAYAVVWLIVIGYVFMLWRRLDRVERELRDVSARLPGAKRV